MHTPTLGYADTGLTRALRPITQYGLLATVAAQLLTFFKADSNSKHPESAARDAILVFTYLSLMFSILLTVTTLSMKIYLTDPNIMEQPNNDSDVLIGTGYALCAYGSLVLSCDCGRLMQYLLQGVV
jgi:ACR3 family arsenite efflux pump ArsB